MGLEYQHLIVAEVVVARGDDLFARLQAFEDFVVLRVLTADADLAFHGLAAVRGDYIYPFAAGLLVEGSARDEDGAFWLSELEVQIICLAGADVGRLLSAELEVCLELPVTHFRIDLAAKV